MMYWHFNADAKVVEREDWEICRNQKKREEKKRSAEE